MPIATLVITNYVYLYNSTGHFGSKRLAECLNVIVVLRPSSKLLEILQMDFEVEELSTQAESQVIAWQLVLPADLRAAGQMEGTMRIYTTQRDFIGLAPLVQVRTSTLYITCSPTCTGVSSAKRPTSEIINNSRGTAR